MSDVAHYRRILRLADLVTPMAIRTAVTLRIADHIGDTERSTAELAKLTDTHPRPLRKLLNHLVSLNLLRRTGDAYGLTELGAVLRTGPSSPFAHLNLDGIVGRTELSVIHLLHKLRTGKSVYHGMYGTDLWQYVDEHNGAQDAAAAYPQSGPAFDIHLIIDHPCWSRAGTFVDVGGNTGALVESLLAAYPRLRGTLIDLPTFAEQARRRFTEHNLSDRATAIGESFFDPLPAGADVYVLSAILADWDDDSAIRLLRNCAAAAGTNGTILVSEVRLTEQLERSDTGMALWVEASMENPDRTAADISMLAERAGLCVTDVREAATRIALELRVQ